MKWSGIISFLSFERALQTILVLDCLPPSGAGGEILGNKNWAVAFLHAYKALYSGTIPTFGSEKRLRICCERLICSTHQRQTNMFRTSSSSSDEMPPSEKNWVSVHYTLALGVLPCNLEKTRGVGASIGISANILPMQISTYSCSFTYLVFFFFYLELRHFGVATPCKQGLKACRNQCLDYSSSLYQMNKKY